MDDTTPPNELRDILCWAYLRLVQAEQVIGAHVDIEPDGFITWGLPLAETTEARDALGRAPSLQPEPTAQPSDLTATAETISALAQSVNRALIMASGQAISANDKAACLDASSHLTRLCDLLE